MKSFSEWQAYDRWLVSQEEELSKQLGQWKEIADRIDRGEYPYHNRNDALTQQLRELAYGTITHLESALTHIREQRS